MVCEVSLAFYTSLTVFLSPTHPSSPTLRPRYLHFDGLDNILCCVTGEKVVHLYPPSALRRLYPHPHGGSHDATRDATHKSAVMTVAQDPATLRRRFPLFPPSPHRVVRLPAGHALFIPNGWWHEVWTHTPTVAVNYWFTPHPKSRFRPTIMYVPSLSLVHAREHTSTHTQTHTRARTHTDTDIHTRTPAGTALGTYTRTSTLILSIAWCNEPCSGRL